MMLFLANENFPIASVRILRNAGYDVVAIIEDNPGIDDTSILRQAVAESRTILTFDSDYGNLIFRDKLQRGNDLLIRHRKGKRGQVSQRDPAPVGDAVGLGFTADMTGVKGVEGNAEVGVGVAYRGELVTNFDLDS